MSGWITFGVLLIVVATVGGWWLFCDWVFSKAKPRLDRWLWRKVGGTGEPPKETG